MTSPLYVPPILLVFWSFWVFSATGPQSGLRGADMNVFFSNIGLALNSQLRLSCAS